MRLEISDTESLFTKAATNFVQIGKKAIKDNGRFVVALSGGSTPLPLYSCLVSDDFKDELDWSKVFFFFGDERDVSPMSDQSNYHGALIALFKPLSIDPSNIFHWRTEIINPVDVARTYEKTITNFFNLGKGEFPKFDLVMLGLGEDGHTASLFPNTSALNVANQICTSSFVERIDANRLTLTFPAINNSSQIMFLVASELKTEILREVLEGEQNIAKYPAQGIDREKSTWFIDDAAAGTLTANSSQ